MRTADRTPLRWVGIAALLLGAAACGSTPSDRNDRPSGSDDGGGENDGAAGQDGVAGDVSINDTGPADTLTADGPRPFNDMGALLDAYGRVITDDAGVVRPLCGNHVCACADGKDNDGDGLVDEADPECTGPLDDDEETFATGIPGDNRDRHQDCFFDGDSGAGNDGCTERVGNVGTNCLNCLPLLPTGCDCYGCCTVRIDAAGTTRTIQIGGSCSLAVIDDADACPVCEQVEGCKNPVDCTDPCSICLGQVDCRNLPEGNPAGIACYTPPDSCNPIIPPPDGGPGDGGPADGGGSDGGATPVCSAMVPCPSGFFCLTGRCIRPQG